MEMKKCQICEGPIVNGRCKWCGMPYRNDETLYHLNENRSEHYKHATAKARTQMREREVPLGDRKPAAGKKTFDTAKKVSYGDRAGSRKTYSTYTAGKTSYKYENGKKKKKRGGKFAKGILVWIVLINVLPAFISYISEFNTEDISSVVEELTGNSAENTNVAETESRNILWELTMENESIVVGEEIPAGTYNFSVNEGYASVKIVSGEGERGFAVSEGSTNRVMLREGEEVLLKTAESEDQVVEIWG